MSLVGKWGKEEISEYMGKDRGAADCTYLEVDQDGAASLRLIKDYDDGASDAIYEKEDVVYKGTLEDGKLQLKGVSKVKNQGTVTKRIFADFDKEELEVDVSLEGGNVVLSSGKIPNNYPLRLLPKA